MNSKSVSPVHKNQKNIAKHCLTHFKNGIYEGDIVNFEKQGYGIYQSDEGLVYIGQFHQDKIHGEGLILYKEGGYQYASYYKNQLNGFAVSCQGTDFVFSIWRMNKLEGDVFRYNGILKVWKHMIFKSGKKRKDLAELRVNQFEEFPHFLTKNKEYMEKIIDILYFRLSFLQSKKNIRIIQSPQNKSQIYIGFANLGGPHGLGVLINKSFDKNICITGLFHNGMLQGLGKIKYDNGDVYIGNFRNDRLEGYGYYFISEKNEFMFGKFHNSQCQDVAERGTGYPEHKVR